MEKRQLCLKISSDISQLQKQMKLNYVCVAVKIKAVRVEDRHDHKIKGSCQTLQARRTRRSSCAAKAVHINYKAHSEAP